MKKRIRKLLTGPAPPRSAPTQQSIPRPQRNDETARRAVVSAAEVEAKARALDERNHHQLERRARDAIARWLDAPLPDDAVLERDGNWLTYVIEVAGRRLSFSYSTTGRSGHLYVSWNGNQVGSLAQLGRKIQEEEQSPIRRRSTT